MRQPITLKIKFKSASLDQFIERYSVDVSRGGIFIRTKEPLAVGTQLKFEFQLQDSSALISGEGTVTWTREHDPNRAGVAPGMGVRFDKLASASGQVLDQILLEKTRRGESQVESRFDAGVRANQTASGTVVPKRPSDFDVVDSKAGTPLPKPAPGLGLEGAEEEFGQESTRVMQEDLVAKLTERTRDVPEPAEESFGDEPTRARSAEEIDDLVRATSRSSPSEDAAVRAPKPTPIPSVEVAPTLVETPTVPQATLPEPAVVQSTPAVPYIEERPPTRAKSSSGLPIAAAAGLLIAAGVGYAVMSGMFANGSTTPPVTVAPTADPTTPVSPAQPVAPTTPDPTAAKPEPVPATPSVVVTSDPPGATITVDGTAKPEPTPTTLTGLDATKPHGVQLTLKGYLPFSGTVTPREGAKVDAKLVPNEKIVEVSSTPPGADILLDGKKVGRTPFAIHKLDVSTEHKVELHRPGFVVASQSITASDAWEPKSAGKDVLAVAVTLAAEPPKARPAPPMRHPPVPVVSQPTPTPAVPLPVAPPATPDPPPADTPKPTVADKPVDKPVEKPVEKKDKPADDDRAIKSPAFLNSGDSTGESEKN